MRKETVIEVSKEKQVKPIVNVLRKEFPNRYPDTIDGTLAMYSDLQVITRSLKIYLFINGYAIKEIR